MTEKTGIIFLQKDKFQLYSPYSSNILEFRFVTEISQDFDLYNKPVFENLLKAFVVNNKIQPENFIIIIADNASFIKDFTQTPSAPQSTPIASALGDLQIQANEFLEHVPFDEVAGKTYPLPNGIRAYATNKEMFEGIKKVLEEQGFIVELAIPGFVFGTEVSGQSTLNINIINVIFQKINLVKEYNLLTDTKAADYLVVPEENEDKGSSTGEELPEGKKENKNLVLIIGISVIALIFIITGVIIYLQFATISSNNRAAVVTPAAKPIISPKTSQSISQPTLAAKDLTVQIVSASSSAAALTIKTTLGKYGFKSIESQVEQSLGVSSNLLIFSEKVNSETKILVTTDVRKVIPDILVQEKTESKFDIVVMVVNQ